MKTKIRYYAICFILVVSGIILDQSAKRWAAATLINGRTISIIPDILELIYVENRGAAFGMMQGRQWFFLILTVIVSAAIIYMLTRVPVRKRMFPCIICLLSVLSGAIGNLIDRAGQGYVVDFIYFKPIDFPVFNIADIFVTCGMAVLMLLLLFCYKDDELQWLEKGFKHHDEGTL